ncbi:hypothetical protein TIFTF001_051368 [Ficus carica]|nr:hypothetical protein TIFTF001_051368 [Ficus carica]
MYGNELPRVVLIRIRFGIRAKVFLPSNFTVLPPEPQFYFQDQRGSEASLAFQGIEEELRLRTLDRTQEVVSLNGDSSPVMCCKDIFLGYVTLPAND